MKNYDDDSKFIGVINELKKLNKIEAPQNFEKVLFDKLSQTSDEQKLSLIDRIFTPVRLIPTAGLAATIIILFFMTNIFVQTTEENPLLANPREREDLIVTKVANNPTETETKAKSKTKEDVFASTKKDNKTLNEETNKNSINDPNLGIRITGVPATNNYYNGSILTSVSPDGSINKNGLDYKQIYLQRLQRAQIEQLRKKMEEMQRNNR